MKKKLAVLLISGLVLSNSAKAEFGMSQPADFTGEAFFTPPEAVKTVTTKQKSDSDKTTPPIKQLRLKMKEKMLERNKEQYELAPTTSNEVYMGEVGTSEYASKDLIDDFEDMTFEDFESNEDEDLEQKKSKKLFKKKKKKEVISNEDTENIILDCDNVNYDTENYLVYATGDVNVKFVKQDIDVKADIITFDRMNNTIKAEGDVRIIKSGQTITGDYIFVDMNEENALIEHPLTKTGTMEIKSRKGYVYSDKIVQEDGSININESFPIHFRSVKRGPRTYNMLVPKGETLTDDIEKGIIKFKAKEIKITQKGNLEIISFKKPKLFKGDKTIFKTNSVKIYTNKNREFVESDHWEIGAYRGLGVYAGPGIVFELPKGSVLKAMPILNYKSGFGVGGLGRFSSATNKTTLGYGTAQSKFVGYGRQELDDNLYLQYGVNGFMDEWFLGRRRPKYGVSLVYDKGYSAKDFLIKNQQSSFRHRFDAGYYQDLDFDTRFEKLKGNDIGTTRFKYMAEAQQNFFEYKNEEELKAFSLGMASQLSAAVYGTGDTQVIGRLGPRMHIQYKRWMQDLGYFASAYDDNSPMPMFDSYRYGKHTLYLREYLRLCRWLTVSWFGAMNISNDSINGRTFQENGFYFSFGPDDMKLSLGYDFIRENLYCIVEVMMDAKGTKVEYDTLEIKKHENSKKAPEKKSETAYESSTQPKVLQRAIVEDIKVMEDVL